MNAQKHQLINEWLNNLQRALDSLPTYDVQEILAEAEEHIYERVDKGVPPLEVLEGFGTAEAYAQGFVDEYLLNGVRISKKTVPMFRAVIRFASRSLAAGLGLLCATIAGYFGIWSLGCMVVKIFYPDRVGLWLDLPLSAQHRYEHSERDFIPLSFGHDHIVFGFQNTPPPFSEYLGIWSYPCLMAIALLSYFALRASLLAAVKRIHIPANHRHGTNAPASE